MRSRIIVWLTAVAIAVLPGNAAFAQTPSDISGHWAEKKIQFAIDNHLFDNQPHLLEKFEPNTAMTRAEFCATLNQLFGFIKETDVIFKDVKADDWFAADIKRAYAAGYLKGDGSGYARPNELLTRAQAAVMLYTIEKDAYPKSPGASKKFKDYDKIPGWALEAVDACVKKGVFVGDEKGNFRPGDNLTRAEVVSLLFGVAGL